MRMLTGACLFSVLVGISTSALAEDVGEATRVQRFAYQTPSQTKKVPLYRFGSVERNARLETVPSGALEVTFTDGSRLTLGSASALVVDDYVFGDAQRGSSQTLKMTRGLFRFVSGSMPKDHVKLQTPTVSIGIRGTVVKAEVNEDGSGVVSFEHGQGFITNNKGQTTQMQEGDMVKVGADGSISPPSSQSWSAGDTAIDQGLNPFGQQFNGPAGGSGGSDGSGSPAGSRSAAGGQ